MFDLIISFFQLRPAIQFFSTHNFQFTELFLAFQELNPTEQLSILLPPLFPFFLLAEMAFLCCTKVAKQHAKRLCTPILSYVLQVLIGLIFTIDFASFCYNYLHPYALFTFNLSWSELFASFVIWEFAHFVFHYSSHKVRILWCFHSPHHAPDYMNLSVVYVNNFFQGIYAQVCRVTICTLAGLDIQLILCCMFIDFCWGALIHFSEELWPSGITGIKFIDKLFLMPLHHRVHHAKNPTFIDTNFCNTLPLWDRIFGTYKEPEAGEKPHYGITRPLKQTNFFDLQFGEIYLLLRDLIQTKSWKQRLQLIFYPPDWKPNQQNTKA